jgi:hypothetical protein
LKNRGEGEKEERGKISIRGRERGDQRKWWRKMVEGEKQ